jgi:NAD(P)-dependent dehydrogenase (short-subunit alcohol dehydrogenase family)
MNRKWALILGASSGFGGATAIALAEAGYNVAGIHLDRQATMENVNNIVDKIKSYGSEAIFYNMNAADETKRNNVLDELKNKFSETGEKINLLMHSLAFGTLNHFITPEGKPGITQKQMNMTLDVMAHSLVYWTQGIVVRNLFANNGRIFGMTSSGSVEVIPTYGAVSAAKSTLESHIRQLSVELASRGITANAIMAGVTDTPALRKIPGNNVLLEGAKAKNPTGRLTTPEDVANAIVLLSDERASFITGNVIQVDGGELISAIRPV